MNHITPSAEAVEAARRFVAPRNWMGRGDVHPLALALDAFRATAPALTAEQRAFYEAAREERRLQKQDLPPGASSNGPEVTAALARAGVAKRAARLAYDALLAAEAERAQRGGGKR